MGWSAREFSRTNGTNTGTEVWQDDRDEPVDILTCAIEYRFEESIHIQKDIAISNLETWLEEKDPQSCRAILTLAGF